MKYTSVDDIRQNFLDFFLTRDHNWIAPSKVVPNDDPTLLFINSGMAPMKSYFLGTKTPPHSCLVNIQDCIRTNDIADVGDSYHGSSFRMLGSWSFGHYFKEQAIALAFELLTEGYGFPPDRLFATVLGHDDSLPNVPPDEESMRVWKQYLPETQILSRPASDNFWGPAGESGPCGPCTEVFYDRGDEFGIQTDSDPLVSGRHIEIWNAGVFMQYDMDTRGTISELPLRCVDTGAGLERMAMVLQDVESIHQVDQYSAAYRQIRELVKDDRRSRIIFDHTKTSLLIMSEGLTPGNQGQHYVLRQLIRRAMTALYLSGINCERLSDIAGWVTEVLDEKEKYDQCLELASYSIQAESFGFSRILNRTGKLLDKIASEKYLSAETAFVLKATHGIPVELLSEFCLEHKIAFPKQELDRLLKEHSTISRG